MRRTMPSVPGAVETWMRSVSLRWWSRTAVRSIAGASLRTLTASIARAGDIVLAEKKIDCEFEIADVRENDRAVADRNPTNIGTDCFDLAGTIDALFHSKKTSQLHIFDWKTGKFLTNNHYNQFLNKPFQDLPDNQLSIYSLQVSLYRLMLAEHNIPTSDAYLIHCSTPTQRHRALDLRARLKIWLDKSVILD